MKIDLSGLAQRDRDAIQAWQTVKTFLYKHWWSKLSVFIPTWTRSSPTAKSVTGPATKYVLAGSSNFALFKARCFGSLKN